MTVPKTSAELSTDDMITVSVVLDFRCAVFKIRES